MKMTNGEILDAVRALNKLTEIKIPVKTSLEIAKLSIKFRDPLDAYNKVLGGLWKTYEVTSEKGEKEGTTIIKTKKASDLPKLTAEFNELLNAEVELSIDVIKLPQTVASTCDACHHNMDKKLEIEPSILIPLVNFVEVE